MTDHVQTLVDVVLAVEAGVARNTGADVPVDLILAVSVVAAGHVFAVVYVVLAVLPLEAVSAGALVAGDVVGTDSPVLTRTRLTLVNVNLTVLSLEALLALTLVAVDLVYAVPVVMTRVAFAVVRVGLAELSLVAQLTGADEVVLQVKTAPVETRVGQTLVHLLLAARTKISCNNQTSDLLLPHEDILHKEAKFYDRLTWFTLTERGL